MILSTLEKTLKTLGAPLLWVDNNGLPPLTSIQGISITCSRDCDKVVLSELHIDGGRISVTFSVTRNGNNNPEHILCYLDTAIVTGQFVYELSSASDKFINGWVTIYDFPNNAIDYSGNKMYVNPLYVQWVDLNNSIVPEVPTFRVKIANNTIYEIPINNISWTNTNDVVLQNNDGVLYATIPESAESVQTITNDQITSINGIPLTSNTATIDLENTGISVRHSSDIPTTYVELTGAGGDSCPNRDYAANSFAPNGRLYKCPLDILYTAATNAAQQTTVTNNPATVSNYDYGLEYDMLHKKDNIVFNAEYSGCETSTGCFAGLPWYRLNDKHDLAAAASCNNND